MMEDHDSFAGAVGLYAFANCGNDAGSLVAEDAGGGVGACGKLLEVSAANATGVNADEHFSRSNGWDRDGLEADVVYAPVDRSLHGRGNGMRMRFHRELSGNGHRFILDDIGGWFVSNQ